MTTFTWTIAQLERNADDGGVTVAHWRVTGTEGDHSASAYGTQSFTPDSEADGYVAFADLTEATVLAWVWGQAENWKTDTESAIQAKIDALANPETVSGMPWAE